jgi:membrane-bound serine protease (ClpP class)
MQRMRKQEARSVGWGVAVGVALCGVVAGYSSAPSGFAEPARPVVYVIPIKGIIDLGLAPFVERTLKEATNAQADAVILDVDTFGGRVDAAVQIRDALLRSKPKTIAFVNKRAISAGALISLAADTIAMADGGTIGAATPVQIGIPGAPAQPVEEKTVSYMRKEFRATAESRKRPPMLAEAMVDADVEVSGVVEKGKLLTLTTEEALELGLADLRAEHLDDLLAQLKLSGAEVHHARESWAESVVRVLTNPIVSSILIAAAMMGIIVEIQTPGFGVPGALGLAGLALFLWGHWLVQLAGWEEVLLIGTGLLLLIAEVFVIPGFGIAGALGIVALLWGLGLSLIGAGATWTVMGSALGQVTAALRRACRSEETSCSKRDCRPRGAMPPLLKRIAAGSVNEGSPIRRCGRRELPVLTMNGLMSSRKANLSNRVPLWK